MSFPAADFVPEKSDLIYDANAGDNIETTCQFVIRHGYAGLVFNGVFVRKELDDTEFDLYHKYKTKLKESYR